MAAIKERLLARLPQAKSTPHGRDHINMSYSLSEAVADAVVAGTGSWRFIIVQTVIVTVWRAG
jgi:uncharacterized membrane protein